MWTVIGMGVYPLGSALAVAVMDVETLSRAVPIASGGMVLLAGAIQCSRWKAHHLACCRQSFEPHVSRACDARGSAHKGATS